MSSGGIGVTIAAGNGGVAVTGVSVTGAAAGKLQKGDVILSAGGVAVKSVDGAKKVLGDSLRKQVDIALVVRRGGAQTNVTLPLAPKQAKPAEAKQQPAKPASPAAAPAAGAAKPGTVGMVLENAASGVAIVDVVAGGAAYACGQVRKGDVIVAVDGNKVANVNDAKSFLKGNAGAPVKLSIRRAGQPVEAVVTRFAPGQKAPAPDNSKTEKPAPSKAAAAAQKPASSGKKQVGVGMSVTQHPSGFLVKAVVPDGAAARSGKVKAGQILTAVDGKPVKGLAMKNLVPLLVGDEGSSVVLSLQPAGVSQPIQAALVRGSTAEGPPVGSVAVSNKEEAEAKQAPLLAEQVASKLEGKIKRRPSVQELEEQNILHAGPGGSIQATKEALEKEQKKDKLASKLASRPEKQRLEETNILHAGPGGSLQATKEALEKEQKKDKLASKLASRPEKQSLEEQHILHQGPPGLQAQKEALEKAQKKDKLEGKIKRRPSVQELEEQNILHSGPGGSIQATKEALEKAQKMDKLSQDLSHRPTAEELEVQGILQQEPENGEGGADGEKRPSSKKGGRRSRNKNKGKQQEASSASSEKRVTVADAAVAADAFVAVHGQDVPFDAVVRAVAAGELASESKVTQTLQDAGCMAGGTVSHVEVGKVLTQLGDHVEEDTFVAAMNNLAKSILDSGDSSATNPAAPAATEEGKTVADAGAGNKGKRGGRGGRGRGGRGRGKGKAKK